MRLKKGSRAAGSRLLSGVPCALLATLAMALLAACEQPTQGPPSNIITVHPQPPRPPTGEWTATPERDYGDFRIAQVTRMHGAEVVSKGHIYIFAYRGDGAHVEIPPYIDGFPVVAVGQFFTNHTYGLRDSGIERVTLPHNLWMVGAVAFALNRLTEICIPETVEIIGFYAFASNQLREVVIPGGVRTMIIGAFAYNHIYRLDIRDGIGFIPARAFYGNKLERVALPDSIREIHTDAFAGNPLAEITIGEGVELGSIREPDSPAFPSGFDDFYRENGKRAGTYTFNGETWVFDERLPGGS